MNSGRWGAGWLFATFWLAGIALAANMAHAGARASLPLEVRIDLAISQVEQSLLAEDHEATLEALAELRELAPDLDMPDLLFYEARALAETDVPGPALGRLLEFLSTAPRDSGVYADGLALLPEIEAAAARREAAEARWADIDERLVWIEEELERLEAESASVRRELAWAQQSLADAQRELGDFRAQVQDNCREDWQLYNAGSLMRLGRRATRDECINDQYRRFGALRGHEDAVSARRRELDRARAGMSPYNDSIQQLQRERAQLQAERNQG